jgi:HTH-type transcriptional regulator / antitoxin HipB
MGSPRDIGSCVRNQRRRRGWTQQELADRVGVSRTFVSQLELGKPTTELALALRTLETLGIRLIATDPDRENPDLEQHGIDLDGLIARLGSIDG